MTGKLKRTATVSQLVLMGVLIVSAGCSNTSPAAAPTNTPQTLSTASNRSTVLPAASSATATAPPPATLGSTGTASVSSATPELSPTPATQAAPAATLPAVAKPGTSDKLESSVRQAMNFLLTPVAAGTRVFEPFVPLGPDERFRLYIYMTDVSPESLKQLTDLGVTVELVDQKQKIAQALVAPKLVDTVAALALVSRIAPADVPVPG